MTALTCAHHVFVTFLVPHDLAAPGSGPCWSAERIDNTQNPFWWNCNRDGSYKAGTGNDWEYDDTNFSNANDAQLISNCATHGGGLAYIFEGWNSGRGWDKLAVPGVSVTRYYTEVYTGDSDVESLLNPTWENNQTIGRPTINIGPAGSVQAVAVDIDNVCTVIANNTYMGIYSSSNINSTKLGWIQSALTGCTY